MPTASRLEPASVTVSFEPLWCWTAVTLGSVALDASVRGAAAAAGTATSSVPTSAISRFTVDPPSRRVGTRGETASILAPRFRRHKPKAVEKSPRDGLGSGACDEPDGQVDRGLLAQALRPDERAPRLELERVADGGAHGRAARQAAGELVGERLLPGALRLEEGRIHLGVAGEHRELVLVGGVPAVDRPERGAQALDRVLDAGPGRRLGERVARGPVGGAGGEERVVVGEVGVDRVPLDARALGDRAQRRPRGAERRVQVDRGLDDTLPGLRLLLGPLAEAVRTFFRRSHCTPSYIEFDSAAKLRYQSLHIVVQPKETPCWPPT